MPTSADRSVESFTDLYERVTGPGSIVSAVIVGHLTIEFLLRRLVVQYDSKLEALADELNHARLIALTRDIGVINEPQAAVLVKINQLRNKLAHRIAYVPSVQDLLQLYQSADAAFCDLTDGIAQGREALSAVSRLEEIDDWVLPELFVQIAYDLHHKYIDRGGDDELF